MLVVQTSRSPAEEAETPNPPSVTSRLETPPFSWIRGQTHDGARNRAAYPARGWDTRTCGRRDEETFYRRMDANVHVDIHVDT